MFRKWVAYMEPEKRVQHYEQVIKDAAYHDKIKTCKELEQYIVSLEPDIMSRFDIIQDSEERLLTLMIIQHTLVTFNTGHHTDKLLYTSIYHASCYLYLSLYFNGVSPADSFRTLHQVWRSNPSAELKLKLCYCNVLLKHNHYNMLKQLINDNKEDFLSTEIWPDSDMCIVQTWVMLYLLSQSITQHRTDIITKTLKGINYYFNYLIYDIPALPLHLDLSFIEENLMTYILNLNGFNGEATIFKLQICLLYCQQLRNQNNYMKYKSFIEQHIFFILSMTDQLKKGTCTMRKQYTLVLMHYCAVSTDAKYTDLALATRQKLGLSFLMGRGLEYDCYCYGGKKKCQSYNRNREYNVHTLNFDLYLSFKNSNVTTSLGECYKDMVIDIEKNCEIDRPRESVFGEGSITKMNTGRIQKCKGKLYNRAGIVNDVSRIVEYVHRENLQCRLNEIIKVLSNLQMQPETQDIIVEGVSSFIHMIYFENKENIFTLLLDLHMETCENSFVNNLTNRVGRLLNFEDDIINDGNRILYRCFCILRTASRRNKELNINIEKYNQHFTFILFDKEKEINKLSKMTGLLVMLLLILTTITTGGHHKSAELKKYLSLKYEYDDAILYLLWCSGDVEINPGPTLKKLKPLRSSEKNRKWINEMCSTLVKLVKGIAVNSKPKSLWKDKPIHWPQDQPFFDPSNKSEVGNDDDQSEKRLLNCLLDYCEKMGTRIPEHFQKEITAWKDGNKTKLFEIYIERKELTEIDNAIQILNKYAETTELKKCLSDVKILIDHKVTKRHHNRTPNLSHADIIRDLALTFCRIAKGLNPVEKSDGIWKVSPTCWQSGNPFYSPHNAGKRTEKGQDKNLVNNLLKYCDDNDIAISPKYQVLADAWKLRSKDDLHRIYTVWSSTVIIEHSLKYLQLEGILEKHSTLGELNKIGLTLDSKEWDLNSGLDTSSPSQDSGFNDSDCPISSLISSPDISRKGKMKSLKNQIQQVHSKHPSDHQQSSPCTDNDFITHVSLSLVSKSESKLPLMSKSDTKISSTSKSDTKLPTMSKSDTMLPSMSKSDTTLPSMSKSDTKISSTSKSDTKLPSMSKSDTKLPSMSKSDTKLTSMSKSDTKISSMSHESDIKVPSKSKSDTKLPDENAQSSSYLAQCRDADTENQPLTKILPCGGKEYEPNLSKPSTTSNNFTTVCGVGYCAAASGSCSAFKNENYVVVKSTKVSYKRRKFRCDTGSNGKKLKLSDTTVHLPENTTNPGPIDVHIDTSQQTDSDLNLSDDFIVSMVDQMNQDLTESDLEDSITTIEDDTNTDSSSVLPDEIIASYINDFLTCDNPEEKLEKDMDL